MFTATISTFGFKSVAMFPRSKTSVAPRSRWLCVFNPALRTNSVWSYSTLRNATKTSKRPRPNRSQSSRRPRPSNRLPHLRPNEHALERTVAMFAAMSPPQPSFKTTLLGILTRFAIGTSLRADVYSGEPLGHSASLTGIEISRVTTSPEQKLTNKLPPQSSIDISIPH